MRKIYLNLILVSIHAPTRGATLSMMLTFGCSLVSIHAPTRGATYKIEERPITPEVSIHAPTRGATARWLPLVP